MKENTESDECKEAEMPKKAFTALSDDELEQVSGGKIQCQVSPVAGPPLCFCAKKTTGSAFAHARCTPLSACPYYEDCMNPEKKKRADRKRK